MTDREVLEDLIALAERAGIPVQQVPRGQAIEGGAPVTSAPARLRGELRVLLVGGDSIEERIAVIARVLVAYRSEWLEQRHLAPALRARLEGAGQTHT